MIQNKIESTEKSLKNAKSEIVTQKNAVSKLKTDIKQERAEKDAIAGELKITKENYEKLKKKQLQTGRERDVFILAFSILGAISVFGLLRPFFGLIPPPYSYAVYIAAPVVVFFGCFYGVRLLVQLLVKLVF
jgi:hypothetical protein